MTREQQAENIHQACREAGLDGHVKWIERKTQAGTWAEKIAVQFKERDPLPVKNSYMYCNTLDMCFFYGQGDTPSMAYAGQVSVDNTDIKEGKLLEAFKKARQVLGTMKELAAKQEESNHLQQ